MSFKEHFAPLGKGACSLSQAHRQRIAMVPMLLGRSVGGGVALVKIVSTPAYLYLSGM